MKKLLSIKQMPGIGNVPGSGYLLFDGEDRVHIVDFATKLQAIHETYEKISFEYRDDELSWYGDTKKSILLFSILDGTAYDKKGQSITLQTYTDSLVAYSKEYEITMEEQRDGEIQVRGTWIS